MKRFFITAGVVAAAVYGANKMGMFCTYDGMTDEVKEMRAKLKESQQRLHAKPATKRVSPLALPHGKEPLIDLDTIPEDPTFGLYYDMRGDTAVVLHTRNSFALNKEYPSDTLFLDITFVDESDNENVPDLSTIIMDFDAASKMVIRNAATQQRKRLIDIMLLQ